MNIRRIAEMVGTSHMTVSRALNGSPLVAEETRKRVLEVAGNLGYQINAGARGLATGLTTTVGILYPHHRLRSVESWYTSQLMHDIRSFLWDSQFDSLIAGYDTADNDLRDITRLMAQKKVDGLILIGYEISEAALTALAAITRRYVAVNRPGQPWMEGHPAVYIDQKLGGALAAQTLRKGGCNNVAVVLENQPQFTTRMEGFAADWGDDFQTIYLPDGTYETACTVAQEQFARFAALDGLFVGSDLSALGIMSGLLDRDVKIPEEVSIVGFDDIEWARYARPALTTVHQPRGEVARAAARTIVERISGDAETPVQVFSPRIIFRESCR